MAELAQIRPTRLPSSASILVSVIIGMASLGLRSTCPPEKSRTLVWQP